MSCEQDICVFTQDKIKYSINTILCSNILDASTALNFLVNSPRGSSPG